MKWEEGEIIFRASNFVNRNIIESVCIDVTKDKNMNIKPGKYYLAIKAPQNSKFTRPDAGDDDTLDSDASSYGRTEVFVVKEDHAFIDHIEYISTDIQGKNAHEAVSFVLDKMPAGHYNTDLGNSLQNFADHYMDKIDSRSTFIVVGDGRNNYNEPSIRIFRELARRSHRTIWLNPEAQALWGSGDSDMPQYAPYCDSILQIRTLSELSAAVDRLLSM